MNEPNQPLRDYRGMDRLLDERQADWPSDLVAAAKRAHIALYIIASNPPGVIEVMKGSGNTWKVLMDDIADFPRAYAAYIATKGE